jgi:agmatine deiminase
MKKFLLLFPILFFLVLSISAQNNQLPQKLTHWLSADEILRKNEIGKNFVETDPPVSPVRNVAEFDYMQGALVRYPFGIPISLIKEMATDIEVTTIVASNSQKNSVIQQYVNNGVDTSHCNFLIAPTDSYWTRDYGPWFESDSANNIGIVDFPYNRPRPNDDEIPKKVAQMLGIPWFGMNLIHTGGNYMTDGMGISSSTTLVWEENPTLTHAQVAQKVHDYLGIENYLVEPDPNGTYIDHIDCWGKFLAPDKILIRKVPSSHSQYAAIEATAAFYAGQTCSYGYPYHVFRVNTPQDQPYTNSLILNNKVLVPFMDPSWDDSAKKAYQDAMPGYEVIGFLGNSGTPWESTDALHCRVMGIADIGLLYIRHIPLTGNQPAQDNFLLTADLIPCSDSAIYNDSVLIFYKVDNGPYHIVQMSNTSGFHYTGYIPKQASGSIIEYYLYAADKSGRHATCPLIGPGDPFTFTSVYTDLTAIPDTLRFETYDDCFNGKYTAIHNYTSGPIDLTYLEPFDFFNPGPTRWIIDPYPSVTFPYPMNAGDSLRFRVVMDIPTSESYQGYWIDTLHFSSPIDTHQVIILLNASLVFGAIRNHPGLAGPNRMDVYPNPCHDFTNLSFKINEPEHVKLDILDINGRTVKTLVDQTLSSGLQTIRWDLLSNNHTRVENGIYLFRLATNKVNLTGRLVIY